MEREFAKRLLDMKFDETIEESLPGSCRVLTFLLTGSNRPDTTVNMKTTTQTKLDKAVNKLQVARKHLWDNMLHASDADYKAVRDALAEVTRLQGLAQDEMMAWVRSQEGK